MSNLVPGSLFNTTGLNRKHTPTPTAISNDELDKRYAREPFNGRPWPASSPVSGVYDIRNTSTKLILINNRKKKESQLRGRSNPQKEEHRYPEPGRHSRCSTPVNKEFHAKCLDSSSPYYEPETTVMDWLNRSTRPQNRFAAGSAVNPRRHTSCQVPSEPQAFDIRLHSPQYRPSSRISLPINFGKRPIMAQRELTPGEQRYFTSITRVYSNNQMFRLKRRQYIDILNQELAKGLYTKKEYQRYRDYISLGRQRQYISVKSRTMSAPVRRSTYNQNETDRTTTSISSGDDKSAPEKQDKSSSENQQHDKRSSTPDKRPQSVKSNSSKKSKSSGRTSTDKSSRSTSAKSTASSSKSSENNKGNGQQSTKDESSNGDIKTLISSNADEENQTSKSSKRETDASDSDTNLPSDRQFSAREGHDRPKSRLGHIPEDTTESTDKKEPENEKVEQKSEEEGSISNISIDNKNVATNGDTTQKTTQEQGDNQRTAKSRDSDDSSSSSSSSDEEDKDPDKLRY